MATDAHSPESGSDEDDPYVDICRSLRPGILVTVNESEPTKPGIDEMEVTHVNEDTGRVMLEGHGGRVFTIRHDDRYYGTAIKEVGETEFSPIHEPVITLEIIGFA